MCVPRPTNNTPIGIRANRFKLDRGTLMLSQMQPPGLRPDPWSHLNLNGYGSYLKILNESFVRMHRCEVFGATKKQLDGYAAHFSGTVGKKLKLAVMDAAKSCKVSPGLVAAVMVFEQYSAKFWKDKNFFLRGGLESLYQAGADDFLLDRKYIIRAVPAARKIRVVKERMFFDKERNKDRKDGFVAVDQLVLVTAAMIKYKEVIVRILFKREGHNFDALREYERFYFTRLSYNPGGQLLKTIREFLHGKDVYERTGPRRKRRALRGATLCTALALHLNETVFQ